MEQKVWTKKAMPKVTAARPVGDQHTATQSADDTQSTSNSEEAPPVHSEQPKTPPEVSIPPSAADSIVHSEQSKVSPSSKNHDDH